MSTAQLAFATGGDNIAAFLNPTFAGTDAMSGTVVTQITFKGATFPTSFTSTSGNATSGLAPNLTDGVNAVSLAATDNGRYDENASGSMETGSRQEVEASLNTDAFWVTGGTPFSPGGHENGTFMVITPPTVVRIDDDDDSVIVGSQVLFTITFSEPINATTISVSDFVNRGIASILVGSITEVTPDVYTVRITPTTEGTLILSLPAGASANNAGIATVSEAIDGETIAAFAVPNVWINEIHY